MLCVPDIPADAEELATASDSKLAEDHHRDNHLLQKNGQTTVREVLSLLSCFTLVL